MRVRRAVVGGGSMRAEERVDRRPDKKRDGRAPYCPYHAPTTPGPCGPDPFVSDSGAGEWERGGL